MPAGRSVLLAGATGLVGRECLRLLLADPGVSRLVVIARRELPATIAPGSREAKLETHTVDFAHLEEYPRLFAVSQVMCAIGTTIKQAGSRERFREVDFGYAYALARLGAQQGARHFLLVSSLGASARSRVFYSRVKGELEDAVRALPYRSVTIARPSVLRGDRQEFRPGERLAQWVGWLAPRRYRPVPAERVADSLVRAADADAQGVRIIESEEM